MDWAVDLESGSVQSIDPTIRCGFELGDWHSFASLNSGSHNATRSLRSIERQDTSSQAQHQISLKSGSAIAIHTENFRPDGIDRTLRLLPDPTIELGDLVLRFVFDSDTFPVAEIADQRFAHSGGDRYLQFDVDKVRLCGDVWNASIHATALSLPDGMDLVIYVRDEPPDRWIVHIRALARHADQGFVRLYDLPVSRLQSLDKLVRFLRLNGPLRYCRERGTAVSFLPNALPLQYVESVTLTANDEVQIQAECNIDSTPERTKR